MIRTLCARLGIGGWYHYDTWWWTDPPHVIIRGPYRTQQAAQGPTWHARLYGVHQAVRWHWRRLTPLRLRHLRVLAENPRTD